MTRFNKFKYTNGYIVKSGSLENEIVNRKISLSKKEKIFIPINDFANWKPTINDIPNLINSIDFFSSVDNLDALEKKLLLLMKLGEVPGVISAKTNEDLDLYLIKIKNKLNSCSPSLLKLNSSNKFFSS
jgi:hypothetical protein